MSKEKIRDAPIGIFLDINFESNFREVLKQQIDGSPSIGFNNSVLLLQVPKLLLCKFQLLALFSYDGLHLPGFQTGLKKSSNFLLLRLRDTSVKWMGCPRAGRLVVMLVARDIKGPGVVCNRGGER